MVFLMSQVIPSGASDDRSREISFAVGASLTGRKISFTARVFIGVFSVSSSATRTTGRVGRWEIWWEIWIMATVLVSI